jgi:predicted metallopeptidase
MFTVRHNAQQQNESGRRFASVARNSHLVRPMLATASEASPIQRKCACGGTCPKCRVEEDIQTKASISRPGDSYELEADRVAEQVVDGSAGHPAISSIGSGVQRQHEEEATNMQTARSTGSASASAGDTAGRSLGNGEPLTAGVRDYFEPRFGRSFANVRVFNDTAAAASASAIDARAYTQGHNVVFGASEYRPDSHDGKKLIAHELTHVVQQKQVGASVQPVQRLVRSNSSCAANVHNAGANPLDDLRSRDQDAYAKCLIAAIGLMFAGNTSMNQLLGGRPASKEFDAYQRRFGNPEQLANGRYRNRFNGATFRTEDAAIDSELNSLADRFSRMAGLFAGNIRYICGGTSARRVGNCRDTCATNDLAWTCHPSHTIVICPDFWKLSDDEQAVVLIHESAHILFGFGDPAGASMTTRRRGRNPVCYSGLVAELLGINPPDPDCPAIIRLPPMVINLGPAPAAPAVP